MATNQIRTKICIHQDLVQQREEPESKNKYPAIATSQIRTNFCIHQDLVQQRESPPYGGGSKMGIDSISIQYSIELHTLQTKTKTKQKRS